MSVEDYHGTVYAFQRWMKAAQKDIAAGKQKAAIVLYDKPAPKVRSWDWRRWSKKRA